LPPLNILTQSYKTKLTKKINLQLVWILNGNENGAVWRRLFFAPGVPPSGNRKKTESKQSHELYANCMQEK
ncbi:MAG: hypothetical protein LBV38_04680, partial [Alistipes sp.]|nr:hypothetical protein [Alistipes sp.]